MGALLLEIPALRTTFWTQGGQGGQGGLDLISLPWLAVPLLADCECEEVRSAALELLRTAGQLDSTPVLLAEAVLGTCAGAGAGAGEAGAQALWRALVCSPSVLAQHTQGANKNGLGPGLRAGAGTGAGVGAGAGAGAGMGCVGAALLEGERLLSRYHRDPQLLQALLLLRDGGLGEYSASSSGRGRAQAQAQAQEAQEAQERPRVNELWTQKLAQWSVV
ncbi:hypothetical protein B484DRAFT_399742 [Ochromonadaceae sp. CCMP2298]|nr:hypothetical protein B484DRAFT_399742 [Ochromonadaceae sp. CCMP2298]